MNKIEKLIEKLCPEGVEVKELGKVCNIKTGQSVSKVDIQRNPGSYPVINSGKEPLGFIDKYNTDNDPIGITSRGAGVGSITWCEGKYFRGNLNYSVTVKNRNKLIVRYLYFLLQQSQKAIQDLSSFNGIPALNASNLKKLKIPIPPLPIQEEIVAILDKFTQLEAELEAELEARKKQYEYYRDELLKFGDDVEWKKLENVCRHITAGGDKPKDYNKGQLKASDKYPYPIFSNGTDENALYGFSSDYKIDKEAITISARGTIGYHTIREPNFTPIVRLITLIPDNELIISKYLNYILDITEIVHSGGSIPQLTTPNVRKIKIPVPPPEEQERIVTILDKFDALVNDITIGLPAEIKARRKQYEYYRDKLLTFKEGK